jgi:hypothetical protein
MAVVLGLFLLVGIACSGDDKPKANVAGSSRSEGNTSSQTTTQNDTANNAISDETNAMLLELPGAIAYLQGDTLMVLKFEGDLEPTTLADGVREETVAYMPDASAIVYASARQLYIYRASDDEPISLGQLRFSNNGRIASWSPNREWFLWQVAGTTLYNLNGADPIDLSMLRIGNQYQWTTDNQLIIIDDNGRQGDNFAYRQVNQVNLETGVPEPIEIDLEAVNSNAIPIEDAIIAAGYDLVPMFGLAYPLIQTPSEIFNSPSIICNTWTIADGNMFENGEIIYRSEPVYMLTQLNAISENELLFLKWTVEDCGLGDPAATLVRYHIDTNQEEILSTTIIADRPPSRNSPLFSNEGNDPRYTVSPDGQFIMWLGGSIDSGSTSINLTNLVNGSNTVVLEFESNGNVSNFVNNLLISEVYWLDTD